MRSDVLVIGGGAAGYFGAIACARARPGLRVTLIEGGARTLAKVKISGGGRCNLTHDCRVPKQLVANYPRGRKELLGPFHRFGPSQTIEWFGAEGVETKTEEDGRMFPTTDRSETVVGALVGAADRAQVKVITGARVDGLARFPDGWKAHTKRGQTYSAPQVLVACGSSPSMWRLLAKLGLPVVEPVPSLFSFNTKDTRLAGLSGVSTHAAVAIEGTKLRDQGPLLVTHWGLSGPAILRLSAWGARELHGRDHKFTLRVRWTDEDLDAAFASARSHGKRLVTNHCPIDLPSRLWQNLVQHAGAQVRWGELTKKAQARLVATLRESRFRITGKSTYKDEFVTAGGVSLKAIDFKRFAARDLPGLYLAGEVLDIDAVTGGFNFQAAWTGGWIAGHAMADAA